VRDRFSGMPVYNGTPCRVEPLPVGDVIRRLPGEAV